MNESNYSNIEWFEAVDRVAPHIVQISTSRGSGTGFLITRSDTAGICSISEQNVAVGSRG